MSVYLTDLTLTALDDAAPGSGPGENDARDDRAPQAQATHPYAREELLRQGD